MTALIVDDDPQLRHRVREQLQDRGMEVSVAADVAEAIVAVGKRSFHVVVIDLGLPDGSGLGVLEALRTSGSTAHVIVLSESSCELDHLEALHRGADDLVVKPFFVKELVALVLAVPRQRDPETDTFFQLGRCDIDLRSRRVTCAGEVIELTVKEFDLLAYLAMRPGHVFSREELLNAVWHSAPDWQQSATVTEHIRRLRSKIEEDPAHPTIVITVRGAGYRLDLPIAAGDVPFAAAPPPDPGVMVHVEGRIVFADAAASDLVAAADGSVLVGRHILELIASTSQAAAAERLADAQAGRPRRSEIMQLLRTDGEQVTVEVASDAADWQGTRARRVQLTGLADASSRLRRLVTGILADVADAVIITDLNSHIRSWNSAAERIYGWSEEAVLGRHLLDILPLPDTDQLAQASEHLEKTGSWKGAVVHTARDGSTVRILGSTTVLQDEGGEPIGLVSVYRPTDVPGEVGVLEVDPGLVARLRQGIIDDEFVVHYQPIVGLTGGRPLTLEALVRWEHPDRGTLAPAEFLAAAERSGSIVELGELVLEKACRQAAAWRRGGADIRLSVNVSTRQLAHPGLAARFEDILRRTGLDPVHLWLEVTETAVVEELESASQVLRTLASRGVGVAIDDFGTGWASLTYLQSFPVHALKIDRRFVAGAGFDHTSAAIVRSILLLGAELGLFVVAEGVETEGQHELLKAMGCTLGQGYFYGHPAPAEGVPIERAGRVPEPAGAEVPVARDLRAVRVAAGGLTAPAATSARPSSAATLQMPGVAQPPPPIAARRNDPRSAEADRIESDAVAAMLRGLLRVSSAHGAVDLLQRTIQQLGGEIVPVAEAGDDALPVDVSLGEGLPVLVEAERFTVARMRLERVLPRLVEDARHAVDLLRRTERLQDETIRDGLTGLANRRVLDRVLPRAGSGSIVMLDLDHFKQVNDEHGHAAGDDVLRAFGRILGTNVRAQDIPCRIGGEEFAVVVADLDVAAAVVLVERIRDAWLAASPRRVTFSAGVAAVTPHGGAAALVAADRALYRAKALGRNRTEQATHGPPGE